MTRAPIVVSVFVPGVPKPQGSKRLIGRAMVESSAGVKPWRADIRETVLGALDGRAPTDRPCLVSLLFVLPRPKRLNNRATPEHITRPDVDKLARAVLDALTSAGLWHDDSQAFDLHSRKRYAETDEPVGCLLTVSEVIP